MVRDVTAFVMTCTTCLKTKPNNKRPYGLLRTLPVSTRPWEAIGIDMVGPLPESKSRDATFDNLTVIINLHSGYVILVPSRLNYRARDVAELIFSEVYKRHGLPRRIVSDRDVLFTSTFWTHLHQLIGTQLRISSAYHPETDGSTERVNRTITTMLRQCIKPTQRDWACKLPAIEFAINAATTEATGYSPFFVNYGRNPPSTWTWKTVQNDEFCPGVKAFANKMKLIRMPEPCGRQCDVWQGEICVTP
jgi:transposase InsO family protein